MAMLGPEPFTTAQPWPQQQDPENVSGSLSPGKGTGEWGEGPPHSVMPLNSLACEAR